MDVVKIELEQFRTHKKFACDLGKVTLLEGPNGSGKSSVVETPATVLVGENSWTGRGIKLQSQIMKGTDRAMLTIVGKRAISRIVKAKGSQLVLDKEEPLTGPMLLSNLKVTEAQLKAALIPQAFLQMPLKDQKDTLFNLIAPKITMPEVAKYIPEAAGATWAKLEKRWKEDHEDEEFVDLDQLYQFCYDARKNYKAKKTAPAENPRAGELIKKISELGEKISVANFDNERVRIGKEDLAKIPEMEAQLAQMLPKRVNVEALAKDQKANEDEILEFEKKLAGIEAVMAASKGDAETVSKAKVGKDKKVVCPIGLDCPHDEAAVNAKRQLAKGSALAKEGEKKSVIEKLKALKATRAKLQEDLEKAEDTNNEIDRLENEISIIKERPDIGDEIDTEPWLTEKKAAEEELKKLATPAPAADDPTVDHLNQIVEALNVHGIKTDLVKKGTVQLEKEVNENFGRFGPWSVRFFIDNEYAPTILTSKGGECLVGELSDGERALFSLILQDTFSARTGINLVVIDNVDLLDAKNAKSFFEVAKGLKSKVLLGMANTSYVPADAALTRVKLGPPPAPPAAPKQGPTKPASAKERPPVEDLL